MLLSEKSFVFDAAKVAAKTLPGHGPGEPVVEINWLMLVPGLNCLLSQVIFVRTLILCDIIELRASLIFPKRIERV